LTGGFLFLAAGMALVGTGIPFSLTKSQV
jgi:hypothetical protein